MCPEIYLKDLTPRAVAMTYVGSTRIGAPRLPSKYKFQFTAWEASSSTKHCLLLLSLRSLFFRLGFEKQKGYLLSLHLPLSFPLLIEPKHPSTGEHQTQRR